MATITDFAQQTMSANDYLTAVNQANALTNRLLTEIFIRGGNAGLVSLLATDSALLPELVERLIPNLAVYAFRPTDFTMTDQLVMFNIKPKVDDEDFPIAVPTGLRMNVHLADWGYPLTTDRVRTLLAPSNHRPAEDRELAEFCNQHHEVLGLDDFRPIIALNTDRDGLAAVVQRRNGILSFSFADMADDTLWDGRFLVFSTL